MNLPFQNKRVSVVISDAFCTCATRLAMKYGVKIAVVLNEAGVRNCWVDAVTKK